MKCNFLGRIRAALSILVTLLAHITIQALCLPSFAFAQSNVFSASCFGSIGGAMVATSYTSSSCNVQLPSGTAPIAISGGEYSISGGLFTSNAGVVATGDSVRIRLSSAITSNTLRLATLTAGTSDYNFRVGTDVGINPQPNDANISVVVAVPHNLAAPVGVTAQSPATMHRFVSTKSWLNGDNSNTITIIALDGNSPTYSFQVRNATQGARLSTGVFVHDMSAGAMPANYPFVVGYGVPNCESRPDYGYFGAQVVVHEVEYLPDNTLTKLALDIRKECPFFLSQTAVYYHRIRFNSNVPVDYARSQPISFEFAPKVRVQPGAVVESEAVTVGGINTSSPISIVFGEYSVDGNSYTSLPGQILNGQTLRLRTQAPLAPDTQKAASVNVGGFTSRFEVGSAPAEFPQPRVDENLAVFYEQERATGVLRQRDARDFSYGKQGCTYSCGERKNSRCTRNTRSVGRPSQLDV